MQWENIPPSFPLIIKITWIGGFLLFFDVQKTTTIFSHSSMQLTCYSQESLQQHQQYIDQNNAAMELINSVTGVDEEGRNRQRALTFAARR